MTRTGLKACSCGVRSSVNQIRVVGVHSRSHRCRGLQSQALLIEFNTCEMDSMRATQNEAVWGFGVKSDYCIRVRGKEKGSDVEWNANRRR